MVGPKTSRFYEFSITSRFQARNKLTVNIFAKLLNETKRSKVNCEQVKRSDLIRLQNKYKYRLKSLNDTQQGSNWIQDNFLFQCTYSSFQNVIKSYTESSKPIDQVTLIVSLLNHVMNSLSLSCFSVIQTTFEEL